MGTGLDLDWAGSGLWRILLILVWIQTVKYFIILDQDRIWTEFIDKNCVIFVIKKLYFAKLLDLFGLGFQIF